MPRTSNPCAAYWLRSSISQPYGGLDSLPTSFFVDRNGIVVAAQLGLTSKEEIEANIKKALGD